VYSLAGLESLSNTLHQLVSRSGLEVAGQSLADRKFAYNRWLAMIQDPIASIVSSRPQFVLDPSLEGRLLAAFMEDSADQQLGQITTTVVEEAVKRRCEREVYRQLESASAARAMLHDVEPDWGSLFDLIVNMLFCAAVPRNRGGSSARAVGVVWMNLPIECQTEDVVEFLVHEMTHHAIFLDGLHYGHYLPGAAKTTAKSAIRGVARPLPCVLDSLLVGAEILSLRSRCLGEPQDPVLHPPTDVLVDGCVDAAISLLELPVETLLTPRGLELFERAVWLLRTGKGVVGGV